jgi:hypothetical protein
MLAKRSGNSGWYFRVLNWLSENGLPLDTCGRLWDLVILSGGKGWATVCERIAGPRSLWLVNWSRTIPSLGTASRISRSAGARQPDGAQQRAGDGVDASTTTAKPALGANGEMSAKASSTSATTVKLVLASAWMAGERDFRGGR